MSEPAVTCEVETVKRFTLSMNEEAAMYLASALQNPVLGNETERQGEIRKQLFTAIINQAK